MCLGKQGNIKKNESCTEPLSLVCVDPVMHRVASSPSDAFMQIARGYLFLWLDSASCQGPAMLFGEQNVGWTPCPTLFSAGCLEFSNPKGAIETGCVELIGV